MSVEAMSVVAHHSRATGAAKLILLGIANHDGDGGAWPSVRTLMRWGSCNERNVQKCLLRLQQLGEIRVERQAGGSRSLPDYRRPNLYHVTLECPIDCDKTRQHRTLQEALFDRVSLRTPPVPQDTPPPVPQDTPPPVPQDTRTVSKNDPENAGVDLPTHHAAQRVVDNRPAHGCDRGWMGEDGEGRRRPCLLCKPHLAARR